MSETEQKPDEATSWLPETFRADPDVTRYKDLPSLIEGYKQTKSFVGADKATLARIPKDDADPAAWEAVYKQLGRPDDPKEYGIKAEGDAAPIWDKALPELHKLGLTKRQVAGIQGMLGNMAQEHAGGRAASAEAMTKEFIADPVKHFGKVAPQLSVIASEEFADATLNRFKQSWGQAFDDKMHAAQKFTAAMLETGDQDVIALFKSPDQGGLGLANLPGFISLAARMGEMMAEPGGLTGGGGANQNRKMSPSEAGAAIRRMTEDKDFGARLRAGDAAAKAEWDNANQYLVA